MIKTGILGADTPLGGNLIRLLIHHPEVELISVYSASLAGVPVATQHFGLIGETDLKFSDNPDPADLDVIFVTDKRNYNLAEWVVKNSELRIVDLNPSEIQLEPIEDNLFFVPALSEIFRKPMVRGARYARTILPEESVLLISLFPLALNLLLNDTIKIKIISSSLIDEKETEEISRNLSTVLSGVQRSFNSGFEFILEESRTPGRLRVEIELKNSMSLYEIEKLYDNVYDDHNFTFVINRDVESKEVLGTQKCIINLSKPDLDILRISAEADGLMRGGAGDAVHAMNLLFGLYEKIGLSHKAIFNYL